MIYLYLGEKDLTVNSMRKRMTVAFLLVWIVLCAFLCACNSQDSDKLYEELLQNAKDDTESFADKVYIIVPQNASGELCAEAAKLGENIFLKTGVYTYVKYDSEQINASLGELPILLGSTSWTPSVETVKTLKYGDYVCRWNSNCIVLGGRYESATLKAIAEFKTKILSGATRSCLMDKNVSFENKESYELSRVMLNGYELHDYTFVYPQANSQGEKKIAEVLRAAIAQKSGYWPQLVCDSDADSITGKIISLTTQDFGGGDRYDACVYAEKDKITICARGEYELSFAVASFAQELLRAADGAVSSMTVGEGITYQCDVQSVNLSAAVLYSPEEPNQEFVYMANDYLKNQTDFTILGEMSDGYKNEILGNSYRNLSFFDTKSGAVAYNAELFSSFKVQERENAIIIDLKHISTDINMRIIYTSVQTEAEYIKTLFANETANVVVTKNCTPLAVAGLELLAEQTIVYGNGSAVYSVYAQESLALLSKGEIILFGNAESDASQFWRMHIRSRYSPSFIRLEQAAE